MATSTRVWRFLLGFVVMAIGSAIGIPVARYAERDDAPGGVVIAALIMIGGVVLAAWIIRPRPEDGVRN
ncbi:MAG TPA: hypothetical protein VFO19_22000 [Vicinamibacterales bacterium]|nr:hypothetical protein [Vicinamibacterales bacterium]